jgi:phosphotransferase system IIB component
MKKYKIHLELFLESPEIFVKAARFKDNLGSKRIFKIEKNKVLVGLESDTKSHLKSAMNEVLRQAISFESLLNIE